MEGQKSKLMQTISDPDAVMEGDFGELLAVRLFDETPLTKKFLVAAYREVSESDGFVITAFFTSEPAGRRKTIWKR